MPDNPLVSQAEANEVLDKLQTFLTDLDEPVDLGYFFGLAFDSVNPDADRNRFATAIEHLLIKQDSPSRQRPKLIVCIDPNLNQSNIDTLFRKVRAIRDILHTDRPLQRIQPITFAHAEEANTVQNQQPLPAEPEGIVFQGGRTTALIPNQPSNDNRPHTVQHAAVTIQHPQEGNPFFYKMTFQIKPDRPEGFTAIYYVYFLRYGLSTPRTALSNGNRPSSYVGKHLRNQVNIQATFPHRQKRIDHYTDSCVYDSQSFYAYLESLGKHENVNDIYITSALSSHDSFLTMEIHGDMYGSVRESSPGQGQFRGTLSNRYFEDFCELLRLMKQLADADKRVLFIQLDSQYRVFNHPRVSRASSVPYEVPFGEGTTFFIDSPKYFRKIRLPRLNQPRGTPIAILDGGKRNRKIKTKKQKRKARTIRKHRV